MRVLSHRELESRHEVALDQYFKTVNIEGETTAGRAAQVDYRDHRYHKPSDEFDPAWKLDGVIQDLEALYGVGRELAQSATWPAWYEGNAFRSAQLKLRDTAPAK